MNSIATSHAVTIETAPLGGFADVAGITRATRPLRSGGADETTLPALRAKPSLERKTRTTRLNRGPIFIENKGQFNEKAKFQVRSGSTTLWVTNEGVVFDVRRPKQTGTRGSGPGANGALSVPDSAAYRAGPFINDPRLHSPAIFNRKSKIETPKPSDLERLVFSQEFIGANPKPGIEASGRQPGIYNYFTGSDAKKWVTHVAAYSEVVYRDL